MAHYQKLEQVSPPRVPGEPPHGPPSVMPRIGLAPPRDGSAQTLSRAAVPESRLSGPAGDSHLKTRSRGGDALLEQQNGHCRSLSNDEGFNDDSDLDGENTIEERFDDEDEDDDPDDNALKTLVKGKQDNIFQSVVGLVIIGNTCQMFFQVDHPDWEYWWIVENSITIFFVGEIALRFYTYGFIGFFKVRGLRAHGCVRGFMTWVARIYDNNDLSWNLFDCAMVFLGVADVWIVQPLVKMGHLDKRHAHAAKVMSTLRVFRMLRILRLLRIFKQFHDLSVLLSGLIDSLKIVGTIMILFIVIIVIGAIFVTQKVGHNVHLYDTPEDRKLVTNKFGTVPASMFTLFQFVTLDDWSNIAHVVCKKLPGMIVVFIFYVILTSFTILSLLTGAVADQIMTFINQEETHIKNEQKESFANFFERMRKMFEEADKDGNDCIDRDEFKKFILQKPVPTRLAKAGIEVDDESIDELFDVLDEDCDGGINWSEFYNGLWRIRGQGQAKDVIRLQGCVRRLAKTLEAEHIAAPQPLASNKYAREFNAQLADLHSTVDHMGERVHDLEAHFGRFMSFMGVPEPGPRGSKNCDGDDASGVPAAHHPSGSPRTAEEIARKR